MSRRHSAMAHPPIREVMPESTAGSPKQPGASSLSRTWRSTRYGRRMVKTYSWEAVSDWVPHGAAPSQEAGKRRRRRRDREEADALRPDGAAILQGHRLRTEEGDLADPSRVKQPLFHARPGPVKARTVKAVQEKRLTPRPADSSLNANRGGPVPAQRIANHRVRGAFLKERQKIKEELDAIRRTMDNISRRNFANV